MAAHEASCWGMRQMICQGSSQQVSAALVATTWRSVFDSWLLLTHLTWAYEAVGLALQMSAAAPATRGVAMDVPLTVLKSLSLPFLWRRTAAEGGQGTATAVHVPHRRLCRLLVLREAEACPRASSALPQHLG